MKKQLYLIKREDFFKIKDYPQYHILNAGYLWVSLALTEQEAFTLWCQGIVARPGLT